MVSKKSTKKQPAAVLKEPPPELKAPRKSGKKQAEPLQQTGAGGDPAPDGPSTSGREAVVAPAPFVPLDVEQDIEVAKAVARARKKGNKAAAAAGRPGAGVGAGEAKGRVVYIGRIPHGFYEDQMSGFFGQFGTISRLKVSRNKKTGKSKHYAFIEFESPDVAGIVAECMHNYLLFGSVLQCSVVEPDKVHPDTFKNANKKFVQVPWQRLAREQHNKERTPEEQQRVLTRLLKADEARRKRLREAGIEYDFEGFQAAMPPKGKKTKLDG